MIWLRRDRWVGLELQYYGPGGGFLNLPLRLARIKSLALRRGFFAGGSVDFLRKFTYLRGLTLDDWKIKDASAVECLTGLWKLWLQTPLLRKPVDLGGLRELRKLSVDPGECVKGVEYCNWLEDLFVARFASDSLSNLNVLRMLKVAQFAEPTFGRVGPVDLPKLETLILKAARGLTDWVGFDGLPALKECLLYSVTKLKTLVDLKPLASLESLLLADCARIDSLVPLVDLPRLRIVRLVGNTRIMDGKTSALLQIPS